MWASSISTLSFMIDQRNGIAITRATSSEWLLPPVSHGQMYASALSFFLHSIGENSAWDEARMMYIQVGKLATSARARTFIFPAVPLSSCNIVLRLSYTAWVLVGQQGKLAP